MNWGQVLADLGAGTRVVVRRRIPGGFTDALGVLLSVDAVNCVIQTRKGSVEIQLATVVAAKSVPPPPPRRSPQPR